jgi:hypothetical protein
VDNELFSIKRCSDSVKKVVNFFYWFVLLSLSLRGSVAADEQFEDD